MHMVRIGDRGSYDAFLKLQKAVRATMTVQDGIGFSRIPESTPTALVIVHLSFQRLLYSSNHRKPAETRKLGHLEM